MDSELTAAFIKIVTIDTKADMEGRCLLRRSED